MTIGRYDYAALRELTGAEEEGYSGVWTLARTTGATPSSAGTESTVRVRGAVVRKSEEKLAATAPGTPANVAPWLWISETDQDVAQGDVLTLRTDTSIVFRIVEAPATDSGNLTADAVQERNI